MTRKSQASLAWIIRRNASGEQEILVQWNQGWQAFSLIGGHVEAGESFLVACRREIEEELECDACDYQIGEQTRLHLSFESFSKSAQAMTQYEWRVYFAAPHDGLLSRLPRNCAWVTAEEIRAQRTQFGLRIEDQVLRVLTAIEPSDESPHSAIPAGSVSWTSTARQDLSPEMIGCVNRELLTVYAGAEVIVKQRFRGYRSRPEEKLILAIEVRTSGESHAHVIKLGPTAEVGGDTRGWKQCAVDRGVNSRLFIAPHAYDLPNDRVLVVYPDVYQFYFDNGLENEPSELENVVKSAIQLGSPSAAGIERVLTQLYSEAHRCFYHNAFEEPDAQSVREGLLAALHPKDQQPVIELWGTNDYKKLRRGAAWLTCGDRKPEADHRPPYVDPVDLLQWAIQTQHIPPMLIGPAHGDLHARNIIVGQVRGEVEWPAVIDFDRMSSRNIVAWDFAKLEVELKCRLFQHFIESPEQRHAVASCLNLKDPFRLPEWLRNTPEHRVAQRVDRMRIMFAIEQRLAQWTNEISSYSQATGQDNELLDQLPGDSAVARGLRMIFRIRREAGIYLGFQRQGRESQWRDEYYFALTAYGVITAKWHSASDILLWALISSGVAAAQLSQLTWQIDPNVEPNVQQQPTYMHVLPWTAKSWEQGGSEHTIAVLRETQQRFPYAIAVTQQLALLLAQSHSAEAEEEARRIITDIANLAVIFRDFETLCRLGRVYKDRGDRCYSTSSNLTREISEQLPMYQAYQAAFKYYHLATEISDYNYYPCVNAATLALLTGQEELQQQLAEGVLLKCGAMATDRNDGMWILASEGEASLLLGRVDKAVEFYRQAIARILPTDRGLLQIIYSQLCRLHWALGPNIVQPVVDLVRAADVDQQLEPGPFGNAGDPQQA